MKKIMLIFGTRPEAIKMAPLIKEINSRKGLKCIICVTGQHREMLDQVLNVFDISPDYDLNIMSKNQSLNDITCLALSKLKRVIDKEEPDIVLVQGDTTTAFAGALAAFYSRKKIGHIEAGLRTNDKYSPYPEEMNRAMITRMADFHFCPTKENYNNLIKENIDESKIYITGNTIVDVFKYTIDEEYTNDILDWVGNDKLIFFTAHRRENLGKYLESVFDSINKLTLRKKGMKVLYPVHLNPYIRELAYKYFSNNKNIKLVDPLSVVDCHNLLKRSNLIVTDSGGIQEEGVSLNKKVIVLRDKTERVEGIDSGNLVISKDNLKKNIMKFIKEDNIETYNTENVYGNGDASKQIIDILVKS